MAKYIIDMDNSEATTIITTEDRNLEGIAVRTQGTSFRREECLEQIERELRFFKISNTKGKRKVLGVPQSLTTALPGH